MPLLKNPTHAADLRASGCDPWGLTDPSPIIPHFRLPFDDAIPSSSSWWYFASGLLAISCDRCTRRLGDKPFERDVWVTLGLG